jgi:Abortive infection C-terminus
MSDLTHLEKRKFERLLGMSSGYVLDFSNRTFEEFFTDTVTRNIYDAKYAYSSGSKANRLRAFWQVEGNRIVGTLMGAMLDYGTSEGAFKDQGPLLEECRKIVTRLQRDTTVPELDALTAITEEKDFEAVARAVREAIEKNEPETSLDRLHTFVMKYVRTLCTQRGITIARDKPLHSLFGEYIKALRDAGLIESEMTSRILKNSISLLEAFNDVRNNRSLAHDNAVLNYDEALLIFSQVANSVRFLRSLELAAQNQRESGSSTTITDDDIPF